MPLLSTKRSDGQVRPRWKDGSQLEVGEQLLVGKSTDFVITDTNTGTTVGATSSTRDRRWYADTDAGLLTGSRRGVQVCLATLPYERTRSVGSAAVLGLPAGLIPRSRRRVLVHIRSR